MNKNRCLIKLTQPPPAGSWWVGDRRTKPPTGRESGWKPVVCTTGRAPFGRTEARPQTTKSLLTTGIPNE